MQHGAEKKMFAGFAWAYFYHFFFQNNLCSKYFFILRFFSLWIIEREFFLPRHCSLGKISSNEAFNWEKSKGKFPFHSKWTHFKNFPLAWIFIGLILQQSHVMFTSLGNGISPGDANAITFIFCLGFNNKYLRVLIPIKRVFAFQSLIFLLEICVKKFIKSFFLCNPMHKKWNLTTHASSHNMEINFNYILFEKVLKAFEWKVQRNFLDHF